MFPEFFLNSVAPALLPVGLPALIEDPKGLSI